MKAPQRKQGRLRLPTRYEWLMSLAVLLTALGIGLLASNVAHIQATLPPHTLYGERDLATLLHDVTRLESALLQIRIADSGVGANELRFALDVLRARLHDRDALLVNTPLQGGEALARDLENTAAQVGSLLAQRQFDPVALQVAYLGAGELRRSLRAVSDNGFQLSMERISAQRRALSKLQSSATLVIAVLGLFGLGTVAMLVRQRRMLARNVAAEREIRALAYFDSLTGLPNRRMLVERLQHALASHARRGTLGGLLFVDLDNFKMLNDTRGHEVGDHLLCQVGQRLRASVRAPDTVARLGGDEFVVILEHIGHRADDAAAAAQRIGVKILEALNQPYKLINDETHSTPSIGVALFGAADRDADELLGRADLAMYQAKQAGRNTLCFYDPEMQQRMRAQSALENDLRRALREVDDGISQFELHFQGQHDGERGLVGMEALLRWKHADKGWVSPNEFVPLAERSGLILPLGRWVLESACIQLARWQTDVRMRGLPLSVNVSARQFRHPDFVRQVQAAIDANGIAPDLLILELTESLLLDDQDEAIARMEELRAHGVGFALDDFGTGYSCLAYLKRLPLSQLKIDRSFVRDVLLDPNDAVIARTVIALGNSLGLEVVAEGVETEGQFAFLRDAGCQVYQGYLFGRPQTASAYEAGMSQHGARAAVALSLVHPGHAEAAGTAAATTAAGADCVAAASRFRSIPLS